MSRSKAKRPEHVRRRAEASAMRTGRSAHKYPKRLRMLILRLTDQQWQELTGETPDVRDGSGRRIEWIDLLELTAEDVYAEVAKQAERPAVEDVVLDYMVKHAGVSGAPFTKACRARWAREGLLDERLRAMELMVGRNAFPDDVLLAAVMDTPAAALLQHTFGSSEISDDLDADPDADVSLGRKKFRRGKKTSRYLARAGTVWLMLARDLPSLKRLHFRLTVGQDLGRTIAGNPLALMCEENGDPSGKRGTGYSNFQATVNGRGIFSKPASEADKRMDVALRRNTSSRHNLGTFDAHSPKLTSRLLTHSYMDLVSTKLWPFAGLVLCVDGTALPAYSPQHWTATDVQERELNDYRLGSDFSFMKDRGTRGRRGLFLCDGLIDPLSAMAAVLQPAAPREFLWLDRLLRDYVRNARSHPYWDRINMPAFLVADAGFAVRRIAAELLYRWGIILVTPWPETYSTQHIEFADNRGVPYCEKHKGPDGRRQRVDAVFLSVSNLPDHARRAEQFPNLKLGDDIRDELGRHGSRWPHVHWCCPECGHEWSLNMRGAEHIYSPLPFKRVASRDGALDRFGLRSDLFTTRPRTESLNSVLKLGGVGLTGQAKAAWLKSDYQWQHVTYGRLMAPNLERSAAYSGHLQATYDKMEPRLRGLTVEDLAPDELAEMRERNERIKSAKFVPHRSQRKAA